MSGAGGASTRALRKRDLETIISRIPQLPNPKLQLEQYATPPHLAARMLWIAAMTFRDLPAELVLDLGAGTGRLGLGSALLGSSFVLLVDVDFEALKRALASARELGVDAVVDAVCSDVTRLTLSKKASCTVQNPPFGVHRKGADVSFLSSALRLSKIVYSVHKAETVEYLLRKCKEEGAEAEALFEETIRLPPTMPHHFKREHRVRVAVLRAVSSSHGW